MALTNSVDICRCRIWKIIIDHTVNAFEVHSPSNHISGNQNPCFTSSEVVNCIFSLYAIQEIRKMTSQLQLNHQILCFSIEVPIADGQRLKFETKQSIKTILSLLVMMSKIARYKNNCTNNEYYNLTSSPYKQYEPDLDQTSLILFFILVFLD